MFCYSPRRIASAIPVFWAWLIYSVLSAMKPFSVIQPLSIKVGVHLVFLLVVIGLMVRVYIQHRAHPVFSPKWKIGALLTENDATCDICLELIVKPRRLRCEHFFCKKCIVQHINYENTCPMCKQWVVDCYENRMLTYKVLQWIKANNRVTEYMETFQAKKKLRIRRPNLARSLIVFLTPFFKKVVQVREPRSWKFDEIRPRHGNYPIFVAYREDETAF